jgi:hypothetical protein
MYMMRGNWNTTVTAAPQGNAASFQEQYLQAGLSTDPALIYRGFGIPIHFVIKREYLDSFLLS